MMPFQTVFRRYELKYIITVEQMEKLMAVINSHMHPENSTQITNEIDYFLNFYENLEPTVFLSYEREAN